MKLPDYNFFCHEQIKAELKDVSAPLSWLEAMIEEGRIRLYNDKNILEELSGTYGPSAVAMYATLLKNACDAYKAGYFEDNFILVADLDYTAVGPEEFLDNLERDCESIGQKHDLGELKSYVLLQFLYLVLGQQIYIFCSDDKVARKGIVSIGNARGISVLSSFIRLKDESGFTEDEAAPYIESYMNCCLAEEQKTFRVQDTSKEKRVNNS